MTGFGLKRRASLPRVNAVVTIKDVAARAGVSTATVSRVLAGKGGVGKKVRAQVSEAVQQLAYQPNRVARDLRMGSRKVIGVVILDLQNPFNTAVVRGIESVLWGEGYSLLLGHSDSLVERERTQLDVLRAEGVGGLILIPLQRTRGQLRSPPGLEHTDRGCGPDAARPPGRFRAE